MQYSTSFTYFTTILHFLSSHDISSEQALAAIDWREFNSDDSQQRVPLEHYSNLLAYASIKLNQPLVGFYLGKDIKSADYGVLGYLIESSKNLNEAIDALLKYDQLVANIGKTRLKQCGKSTQITWHPHKPFNKHVILRNFTGWIVTCRQLLGQRFYPKSISFTETWSAPEQAILRTWFNCSLSFNAKHNCIEFPSAYLNLQFRSANPELYASLELLSKRQMSQFQHQQSIVERLQALLASKPDLICCQLQEVANSFHLSPRQLQRKLKQEQASFTLLLDKERQRRVSLALGQQPMGNIAAICGFKEQSAFNKAFTRWYQCSPSQYLKSNG